MNTILTSAYKGDIVSRLRNWRGLHLAHSGILFEEAADEIERLREAIRRLADQDATLSLLCKRDGSQVVTVTMDATLTDAEREAIGRAIDSLEGVEDLLPTAAITDPADTLRGLLSRTGDCPEPDNVADRNNGPTGSE